MSSASVRAGFTLPELLVALVVLAVTVLAVVMFAPLSLGRGTEQRTYAVNVARGVLDGHRGLWQARSDFLAGTAPSLPDGLRFGCSVDTPRVTAFVYDAAFALTPLDELSDAGTAPHLRRVEVTVRCPNAPATTLSTEIGDPRPDVDNRDRTPGSVGPAPGAPAPDAPAPGAPAPGAPGGRAGADGPR